MTAVALAALAIALTATGGLITFGVWYRASQRELAACRDRLDEQEALAAEYRSARDIAVTAHRVAEDSLATERNLKSIAEAQRNEAQRKTRELLMRHARHLTPDLVDELVADAFTTPLSLVPRKPVSEQPGNELEDPWSE